MIVWLTLVLAIAGFAFVWSNHFDSGFHLDDAHTIVSNPAIRNLSNIKHFFGAPGTFSARKDYAEYEPLLTTAFALDYALTGRADPLLFQIENFFWFVIQLAVMYLLFRIIPGSSRRSALLGAAIYGVHPLAAETVNYALQRGRIFTSIGVMAGLCLWIVWPKRLPADFLLTTPKVPTNEWDLLRIRLRPILSKAYRRFIAFPFPFYLVPLLGAILGGLGGGVVFALLAVAYLKIFEPESGFRRAIIPLVICGGAWVFQTAVVFRSSAPGRVPFLRYLWTEPWVIFHYFSKFLLPVQVTAVSTLLPFDYPWSPLALAGYAGLAAIVWLALFTGRRAEWRAVSFGLWWFLIALLPSVLVPQRDVEAFPRMYLASAGLVLAGVRAAFLFLALLKTSENTKDLARLGGPVLAALLLAVYGWGTYHRNAVWISDEALWSDVVDKNPNDGRAVMNYGLTFMTAGARDIFGARYAIGYDYLVQASKLLPKDAQIETELGSACEQLGRDTEAQKHFERAISLNASYGPAFAAYSEWMLNHQRLDEAYRLALKGAALDVNDVTAHHTLMDLYIRKYEWARAVQTATEALQVDPDDEEATRSLRVADAGVAAFSTATKMIRSDPSVDRYLSLSVMYFNSGKLQECADAAMEAIKLQPDLPEAYVNAAAAYHGLGKPELAIDALRQAVRLNPSLEIAQRNLAYELAHRENLPSATAQK